MIIHLWAVIAGDSWNSQFDHSKWNRMQTKRTCEQYAICVHESRLATEGRCLGHVLRAVLYAYFQTPLSMRVCVCVSYFLLLAPHSQCWQVPEVSRADMVSQYHTWQRKVPRAIKMQFESIHPWLICFLCSQTVYVCVFIICSSMAEILIIWWSGWNCWSSVPKF